MTAHEVIGAKGNDELDGNGHRVGRPDSVCLAIIFMLVGFSDEPLRQAEQRRKLCHVVKLVQKLLIFVG
jgi:hypothetical protein